MLDREASLECSRTRPDDALARSLINVGVRRSRSLALLRLIELCETGAGCFSRTVGHGGSVAAPPCDCIGFLVNGLILQIIGMPLDIASNKSSVP